MDLLKEFKKYISTNSLFSKKDKVLLAVSGGADSVVMAELFRRCGYNFSIAHCNFLLRGKESDQDEEFVKTLAQKHKVEFFCKRFDTEAYSSASKISIQEAARNLRYEFFDSLLTREKHKYIATAHHFNDSIETFFINLLRGTGVTGLIGIRGKNKEGTRIRPLLFASRKDIEAFAKKERLSFRNDSSNNTDDYLRNRIRHHLIPLLLDLNPHFEAVMKQNMKKIEFAESVFIKKMMEAGKELLHSNKRQSYFKRSELSREKYPIGVLSEILSDYGFNYSQAEDIWTATKSGKQFFSKEFVVSVDRDKILLNKIQKEIGSESTLEQELTSLKHPLFTLKIKVAAKKAIIPASSIVQCLDLKKLEFPLIVRKWQAGDFFYPLGMSHKKKVSDFLIDQKISRPEKENVYVITSGRDVVAVLGYRIDDRYKITEETKKVYRIEYLRT